MQKIYMYISNTPCVAEHVVIDVFRPTQLRLSIDEGLPAFAFNSGRDILNLVHRHGRLNKLVLSLNGRAGAAATVIAVHSRA